jgi:hypothetical protein
MFSNNTDFIQRAETLTHMGFAATPDPCVFWSNFRRYRLNLLYIRTETASRRVFLQSSACYGFVSMLAHTVVLRGLVDTDSYTGPKP